MSTNIMCFQKYFYRIFKHQWGSRIPRHKTTVEASFDSFLWTGKQRKRIRFREWRSNERDASTNDQHWRREMAFNRCQYSWNRYGMRRSLLICILRLTRCLAIGQLRFLRVNSIFCRLKRLLHFKDNLIISCRFLSIVLQQINTRISFGNYKSLD